MITNGFILDINLSNNLGINNIFIFYFFVIRTHLHMCDVVSFIGDVFNRMYTGLNFKARPGPPIIRPARSGLQQLDPF